jgi:hypothetical protein
MTLIGAVSDKTDFTGSPSRRGLTGNPPEGIAMFNMATMAADECRSDKQERTWRRWADKAGDILGRHVVDGSEDEDFLHDLYLDGCTPDEAATEFLAQQAMEAA